MYLYIFIFFSIENIIYTTVPSNGMDKNNKVFLTKVQFPTGFVDIMDMHIVSTKQYTNRTNFIVDACREKLLRDQQYYGYLKKNEEQ